MSLLSQLAGVTGLNHAPRFKQAIKNSFYFLQDPLRCGVPLELGGGTVKVPARFARQPWTRYERAATRRVARWVDDHPDCTVIDVGSSIALYSLLVLSRAPRGVAWAIDSERISLQSSRWLCRYVGADRLHVIHGYAGDQPTVDLTAEVVATRTAAQLDSDGVSAEPSHAAYICLDSAATNHIPVHSLDRLFANARTDRPHLVKIDVEGAEMLVLRSADAFVRRVRPQLLVSVHPPALRGFGLKPSDVADWLRAQGYRFEIDVEPHEEHWWCTPV
jgi:FkbM family methyltransferase